MKTEYTGAGIAEPPPDAGRDELSATGDAGRADASRHAPAARTPDDAEARRQDAPHSVWREYFESLLVTAVMALFGMTFIVQAVKVPTGSMQNTILVGDHLLVNKFIFAPGESLPFLPQREIRRGDIVVFKYPGNQFDPDLDKLDETSVPFSTNFVKRVIGLPGDRLEVRGERVYINGEPLAERRLSARDPGEGQPREDPRHHAPLAIEEFPRPAGDGAYNVYYSPETRRVTADDADPFDSYNFHFGVGGEAVSIPEDSYFVMGDNRENSHDSRAWGFVKRDLIIGRAMFVYWSYDESVPSSGNFLLDFFQNSRWNRTGTFIK